MAIRILSHALNMVFGNLSAVLRISLVLTLISFGALYFANPQLALGVPLQNPEEILTLGYLAALIVSIVTGLWIAVAWHRFVLLEENPGAAVPPFHGTLLASYFYRGFLITLLLIFLAVILGFFIGFVSAFVFSLMGIRPSETLLNLVSAILLGIPMFALFYRISPILPAAALGEEMTFSEAMTATGKRMSTWLGLAAIVAIGGFLFSMIGSFLLGISLPLAIIWSVFYQLFAVMLNVSILTTIYGHYVEGRDLNA